MAGLRSIVVHVNDEALSAQAVELAAALAADVGARLTAVLVADPVNAGMGLSAETASLALELQQAQRAALLRTGERLAAQALQRHGMTMELRLGSADPVQALHALSCTADLLITSQKDPARDGGLSTGQSARLLVGSACPVLTVPYVGMHADGQRLGEPVGLHRALVAWSGTREGARALRDALPLLSRASHVELVSMAGSEPSELAVRRTALEQAADYLGLHGVKATTCLLVQPAPSVAERMRLGWVPDVAVAEALMSHAADMGADFMVMGGYGHSRLWELVLGGVTRTMLETMTVPVLMSH